MHGASSFAVGATASLTASSSWPQEGWHVSNVIGLPPSARDHIYYVMDTFVDRVRLASVKVLLKAYAPTVPVAFVSANLGFEAEDECVFFLEDHGCVILDKGGDEPSKVDCKASRASLVDHSIAQRLEEEMKKEQRRAERTNFANDF